MNKNHRMVLFYLTFTLVFILSCSFTFAQKKKKYPPYPDVWEREFVDYLGGDSSFLKKIIGEDILIYQLNRVDKNGEPIRDSKGRIIEFKDGILFFSGEVIKNYDK